MYDFGAGWGAQAFSSLYSIRCLGFTRKMLGSPRKILNRKRQDRIEAPKILPCGAELELGQTAQIQEWKGEFTSEGNCHGSHGTVSREKAVKRRVSLRKAH